MSTPNWRSEVERARTELLPQFDDIPADSLVVVVCLWRRIGDLPALLASIDAQLNVAVTLVLWNNHRLTSRAAQRAVRQYPKSGAIRSIRVVQRSFNIGGIARFVVAEQLKKRGRVGPIFTIDDDMALGPSVLETLVEHSRPASIVGHWAWNPTSDYHRRTRVPSGQQADYVGTGGAAIDIELFDEDFFALLPDRYGAVEDLWASGVAKARGWDLRSVELDVQYSADSHALFVKLAERKSELWSLFPQLSRGERVAVAPDPSGGLAQVSGREMAGVLLQSLTRRAQALVRQLDLRGRAR